ncbi:14_t:CDS:1, partial [Acaulospora morrowiae]
MLGRMEHLTSEEIFGRDYSFSGADLLACNKRYKQTTQIKERTNKRI